MSHLPERIEKSCLNCGADVHGRFCHVCGQENIEPKESFWHLVTHFMYDITHFDGKFFSTLKYLLFKPGFLSHEYLRGRRASYLHPIRMYVFTSAFFFLVFFNMNKDEEVVNVNETQTSAAKLMKRLEKNRAEYLEDLKDTMPAIARVSIQELVVATDSDIALLKRDTTAIAKLQTIGKNNFNLFGNNTKDSIYKNVKTYDSVQKQLPAAQRDNFIERRFARQTLHLKEKYKNDSKAIWNAILDKFKHLFPQMLFVSLPLFALVLLLLYARRKQFYYVNHVVYSIHLYCGTFIIILVWFFVKWLLQLVHFESGWVGALFTLAGFFFWYKSMRKFYEQRRGKTILKYLLLLFLSTLMMTFIFTIFFIFSAMAI